MKRFILICIASILAISALMPVAAVAAADFTPADIAKELSFSDDLMSCVAQYNEECDQFIIALLPNFTAAAWYATDPELQAAYIDALDSICTRVGEMVDGIGYTDTTVIGLMMTTDPTFIALSVDGHNLQDVIK